MSQLIGWLRTFQTAVNLINEFYRAWVSAQVEELRRELTQKELARKAIIESISEARQNRDSQKLIALTHALALLEVGEN